MIPLFKVYTNKDTNIQQVLESGYIGQGQKVEEFEGKLKEKFMTNNLLYVNSCTSAISLALEDIKRKEKLTNYTEVLSTCLSCFATVSPILEQQMRIKWVDIDEETCNIDLVDLENKLTANTRIVILVHWGGHPVNLNAVEAIKKRYMSRFRQPLYVIEDSAHCWDSYTMDDKLIGTSGNYCCFSFQAIKFLTTVDGGLLITPDNESYKRCKLARWFGLDRDNGQSFRCVQNITEFGHKYQPNDVLAEVGLSNLEGATVNVIKHKENAKYLTNELFDLNIVPKKYKDSKGSFWLYTIHVPNRDKFISFMADNEISCSPVHARMDKHDCVKEYAVPLHNMTTVANTMCCIPVGWWLTKEDLDKIVSKTKQFIYEQ